MNKDNIMTKCSNARRLARSHRLSHLEDALVRFTAAVSDTTISGVYHAALYSAARRALMECGVESSRAYKFMQMMRVAYHLRKRDEAAVWIAEATRVFCGVLHQDVIDAADFDGLYAAFPPVLWSVHLADTDITTHPG
jgi:hypothetical protein